MVIIIRGKGGMEKMQEDKILENKCTENKTENLDELIEQANRLFSMGDVKGAELIFTRVTAKFKEYMNCKD